MTMLTNKRAGVGSPEKLAVASLEKSKRWSRRACFVFVSSASTKKKEVLRMYAEDFTRERA